jgi:hypothetical protein
VLILLLPIACDADLPVAETDPTPLEISETSTLVQALYAGETVPNPQGDRLRLMVWLASLEATDQELGAIREAAVRVSERKHRYRLELEAAGVEEDAALAEVYGELERRLVDGLDDEEAAAFAERVEEARGGLTDARALHVAYVEEVLAEGRKVASMLGPGRTQAMANALFVLRSELGEGVRPALYSDLVGRPWRAGDFATLKRSELDEDAAQLDPGGIFTLDAGATQVNGTLDSTRTAVLAAMVLEDPELVSAIDRLLGVVPEAAELPEPEEPEE